MDLKNNKITVKEILANPAAVAIFRREFGELVNHPMVKSASSMPLSKLIKLAHRRLEPEQIERILRELAEV